MIATLAASCAEKPRRLVRRTAMKRGVAKAPTIFGDVYKHVLSNEKTPENRGLCDDLQASRFTG